jgi:DNA processing protein
MNRDDLRDWLHVHLAAGVGPKRFRLLLDTLGSPKNVVKASLERLREVPIGYAVAQQIYEGLKSTDPDAEMTAAETAGVRLVTLADEDYPELLKTCPDPPPVLYVKGTLDKHSKLSLAMVGTRRPSHYGSEQAYRFAFLLAQAGFTIVSGLARGIDAQSHRGALLAKGKTIAVQGCGLNFVYPPEHAELAEQIIAGGGAVISEFPMSAAPQAGNFPSRNRIVAGMTLGTFVVEAPRKSGALITADLASEYNREVFAMPGPIDRPDFLGCHDFIKKGRAKLVASLEDILDELGLVGETLKTSKNTENKGKNDKKGSSPDEALGDLLSATLSADENQIWTFLAQGPNDIDTICSICNLPANQASASLTTLQLKGLIKPLPGNQFSRK